MTPENLKAKLLEQAPRLWIAGKLQPGCSGEVLDIIDPADARVLTQTPAGCREDVNLAVRAAREAFDAGPWRKTPPSQRARLLWKLSDLIEARADELALLETLNNGMPLWLSHVFNINKAIECLRYYAGWPERLTGDTLPVSTLGEYHTYTRREPVGVVAQILPWNMPFGMACGKLAPALAAGCTVVIKPAEQTPLSALRLAQLVQEAGIPDGVVNVVTGIGSVTGLALVEHPEVDKVSFTGSTTVGKRILVAAAASLKRVTLELGGKSPVFIFPDADIDGAALATANGILVNSGQICAAGSRLFVHESVYERVLESVIRCADSAKVGPGALPDTFIGPLVSARQLDRVRHYVRSGADDGARVFTGTQALPAQGYFAAPVVLADVTRDMTVTREEIFGPVLCVNRFSDEALDSIAALGNDTTYGLAAYVWTRDVSVAHRLAARLRVGSVYVNGGAGMDFSMPFGGFKQSGLGREHGREGMDNYMEVKTVSIALAPTTG